MTVNETFEQLVLNVDLNSPAPETEPDRQAWFLARAREIGKSRSEAAGRKLTSRVETFGCQMNARDSEKIIGILRSAVLKRQRRKTLIFLSITPAQSATMPTSVFSADWEERVISRRTVRE